MARRVVTTFGELDPVPTFPSTDEIARLPRRLAYSTTEVGEQAFCYSHAVPAGLDQMGRPGNVFTHCLLDRDVFAEDSRLRPIEMWRSPMWRTPFGQDGIVATQLEAAREIVVGGAVTPRTVINFLLDPSVWRGSHLPAILDATVAALGGGPAVVIAANSADSAALWIGAVEYLMAPRLARTVPFSAFERAREVGAAVADGRRLIGVPRADVDDLAGVHGIVVIDEGAEAELGDLGGAPHRCGRAQVSVTPWSVVADAVLQEETTALEILGAIDTVSAAMGDAAPVQWPLAMAVATRIEDFPDVESHVYDILRAESPEEVRHHQDLWRTVNDIAARHLGTSAGDAFEQAAVAPAASLMRTIALATADARVVAVREVREPGRPIPALPSPGAWVAPETVRDLADSLEWLVQQREAGAAAFLRLADWLVRRGVYSDKPIIADVLGAGLEEVIVPIIVSGRGARELQDDVGALDPEFRTGWLKPAVDRAMYLGHGFGDPSVLDWIYPPRALADAGAEDVQPDARTPDPLGPEAQSLVFYPEPDATSRPGFEVEPVPRSVTAHPQGSPDLAARSGRNLGSPIEFERLLGDARRGDRRAVRHRVEALAVLKREGRLDAEHAAWFMRPEWPLADEELGPLWSIWPELVPRDRVHALLHQPGWTAALRVAFEALQRTADDGADSDSDSDAEVAELRSMAMLRCGGQLIRTGDFAAEHVDAMMRAVRDLAACRAGRTSGIRERGVGWARVHGAATRPATSDYVVPQLEEEELPDAAVTTMVTLLAEAILKRTSRQFHIAVLTSDVEAFLRSHIEGLADEDIRNGARVLHRMGFDPRGLIVMLVKYALITRAEARLPDLRSPATVGLVNLPGAGLPGAGRMWTLLTALMIQGQGLDFDGFIDAARSAAADRLFAGLVHTQPNSDASELRADVDRAVDDAAKRLRKDLRKELNDFDGTRTGFFGRVPFRGDDRREG